MISINSNSIIDFKYDIEKYIEEIIEAQVPKGVRIRVRTPFDGMYFLFNLQELYEIKRMLDRYFVLNPRYINDN